MLSWAKVRASGYRSRPGKIDRVLLCLCQLREWDLWQKGRSHVDVYFPRRAIAEIELEPGRLPFLLPPGTSRRIDGIGNRKCDTPSSCTRAHSDAATAAAAAVAAAGETRTRTRWEVVSPSNATFHEGYRPLDEIEAFARDLAAAYPRQVSVVRLGHSGEGREMFALEVTGGGGSSGSSAGAGASYSEFVAVAGGGGGHVSHDPNSQAVFGTTSKGKPKGADSRCGFLITGAQHAREVSPATLRFFTLPSFPSGLWQLSIID